MKRLLVVIVMLTAAVLCAVRASAQINPGVIGGLTFSSANLKEFNRETMTQYHVGATVRFKLPMGFSIQPSLIYQVKGAKTEVLTIDSEIKVGYLELPVSFQWGPDLLIFRPFVDVSPYVGYALHSNIKTVADDVDLGLDNLNQIKDEAMKEVKEGFRNMVNDLEYGLGLGAGVEVWRFQVLCRYNWNFGPLVNAGTDVSPVVKDQIKDAIKEKNFGGVSLSLTYMFGK